MNAQGLPDELQREILNPPQAFLETLPSRP
jgi:hypothetical protein